MSTFSLQAGLGVDQDGFTLPTLNIKGQGTRTTDGERVMSGMLQGSGGLGWVNGWATDRLELVVHYKHWSYIAINCIGNAIAGLEPNIAEVYPAGNDGAAADEAILTKTARNFHRHSAIEKLHKHRYEKSLQTIKPHEKVVPVDDDHPLMRLVHRPNPVDTGWEMWFELILFLELTGNAYLWCPPNAAGYPCEFWVIPSHWVRPQPGKGRLIDYYMVTPLLAPGGGLTINIPPDEIIHFKWKSPVHKVDGYAAAIAGSEWIDSGESIDRARFFMMKNGCFALGALELGAEYVDPSDQDINRIYAKFLNRIQGEHRFGMPLILPPGAKYNPLMINPQEMAFVESANQIRDMQLALFKVPKEVAGLQDAGTEIAMYGPLRQFFMLTITPKLKYLAQVFTEFLCKRWSDTLRLWWDDPTPTSPEQLNKDITTDWACKATTSNEIRAIRGKEPFPEGGDNPLGTPNELELPWGGERSDDLDVMPRDDKAGEAGDGEGINVDQTPQTADLLATVGGINGAIAILTGVSQGTISRETAVQLLILFFRVSPEDADKIVGDTKKQPQPVPPPNAPGAAAPGAKPVSARPLPPPKRIGMHGKNRLLPYMANGHDDGKRTIVEQTDPVGDMLAEVLA